MSFCRNSVNNSFLGLESFSEAFHQTPSEPAHYCPSTPASPALGLGLIFSPERPLNFFESPTFKSQASNAGNFAGGENSGEVSTGFVDDIGLMSCTESLGFESSDEISTLEDLGTYNSYNSWNRSVGIEEPSSSSSSSSTPCSSSLSSSCYTNPRMNKLPSTRAEKKSFPPPLTSLSENGRRNFVLRPVRTDGRLEIVGVMIERPEILCASRKDGRLTLRLVKNCPLQEQDEKEEEQEENDEKEIVEEGEGEGEGEGEEEAEETGEETDWKIPAAGVRRCYQHVWRQERQSIVTTM